MVAAFEAAKGAAVLLAGFGFLSLLHRDVQDIAVDLVEFLRLDPMGRYPQIFVELITRVSDQRLWLLALLAGAYSTMRFAEAYGLWRNLSWAEWFAVLSGAVYVPVELYELSRGASLTKISVLFVNLATVLYVAWRLWRRRAVHAQPAVRH